MECIAQYLDDLEDLIFAFALKWESIRASMRFAAFMASSLSIQIAGVALALVNPALAAGLATLLAATLLMASVIGGARDRYQVT